MFWAVISSARSHTLQIRFALDQKTICFVCCCFLFAKNTIIKHRCIAYSWDT